MHHWRSVLLPITLALALTQSSSSGEPTPGYVTLGPNGAAWLRLVTADGTWAVQLDEGCPIAPPSNVNVVGQLDGAGAQLQSTDGLTSCQLTAAQFMSSLVCAQDPRTATCDVRFDS